MVMPSKPSVSVTLVPLNVKYGAWPLMTLVVRAVNASLLKADNNNKTDDNAGTIRRGKFDRQDDRAEVFDPKDRWKNKNRWKNEPLYLVLAIFKL
jgi:hypothetical protein